MSVHVAALSMVESPLKPALHVHVKEFTAGVVHVALLPQGVLLHSSMSAGKQIQRLKNKTGLLCAASTGEMAPGGNVARMVAGTIASSGRNRANQTQAAQNTT